MTVYTKALVVICGIIVVPVIITWVPIKIDDWLKKMQRQLQTIKNYKDYSLELVKGNERMGREIQTLTQENEKLKEVIKYRATQEDHSENNGLTAYLKKALRKKEPLKGMEQNFSSSKMDIPGK